MAGPVYKMFRAKMNASWYQLSKEQQEEIEKKMDEAVGSVGVKRIVICDSSWASEEWPFWGVEEFSSIEAVQEFAKCLTDIGWYRYCDSEIMLGTPVPMEST